MKYHHNFNERNRKRFLHRIEFLFLIAFVVLVGIGAWLYVAATKGESANQEDRSTSTASTSYIAANVQIFKTPYFQFQTDRTWSEAAAESKNGKYVYRSVSNSLIRHEFVVYVGSAAAKSIPVTRVLPVTIETENTLKQRPVSDHCSAALPPGQKGGVKTVTYQNVTFECFADNTQYNVIVGQIGGTPRLSLLRPGGTKETYMIYYSNVTANPEPSQLQQIINSFQTR